jgi:acyl-coenzyme A thioesterase PaaI-like protein
MIWDDAFSPVAGDSNPLSPPVRLRTVRSGEVTGTGVWGTAWQGPEGHVHGGMIAAAFDELLGDSQPGASGMTARLEIDYRAPAPLHKELILHSEVESVEGRKTWLRGTLHDGDRLLAEARGLFVRPRRD